VKPLIGALEDESISVRQSVAYVLGKIGDTRAVEPLIKAVSEPRGIWVSAAVALGNIGDMRAVEPLLERLSAEKQEDRIAGTEGNSRYVAFALNQLGHEVK
jgi:HEAT repeat protein